MFKLVQKLLPQQQRLLYGSSLSALRSRFISTSDEVKSGDTIGGLPTKLVSKQKLKKTARTLSTLQNHSAPSAASVTVSKDESRDFMAVFPDLVRDLMNVTKESNCSKTLNWFARSLHYNVPPGKKNRGFLTVLTYRNLVPPAQLTDENLKLARYLGWLNEMLQAHFVIVDDVMDESITRRGQKCWYKVEGVGMNAINDALMVEASLYTLLKMHFSHLDCYVPLMESFHEVTLQTTIGQCMDMLNATRTVSEFTMENYKAIVAYKTAYYTFYMPFASAMHLAGYKDAEAFRQSKAILLEMGHFYQVQDDFLDCFGNPAITGKVGTDIQDNKCSWLAVVAMQRANAAQQQVMKDCYGQKDPAKVERIKELYKELSLPSTYAVFEEDFYKMITTHIRQTSRGVPHEAFLKILNMLYKRNS